MKVSPASVADCERFFKQATAAYARGQRAQAAAFAEQILQHWPDHTGALFLRGGVFLDDGQVAEALPYLEAAGRLAPAHTGIQRALGMVYFHLRDWQAAALALQAARNGGQRDADLLNSLGRSLWKLEQTESAINVYREALQLSPRDAGIYNNLALALNQQHDYAAAITAYRQAIALDPRHADVWSNLAAVLEQANCLDEADEALAAGFRLEPNHPQLYLTAAKCERRRGHPEAAVSKLEDALRSANPGPETRRTMEFELGRNYDQMDEANRAFEHFSRGNLQTLEVWPNLTAGLQSYVAELDKLLDDFTPEWVRTWPALSLPTDSRRVAFLVSFPRSGTTLMDTMLDAHPQITVFEEAPCMGKVIESVAQMPGGHPQALPGLNPGRIVELRETYLRSLIANNAAPQPGTLILDKNPFLSVQAGFIHRLLPQARFIFALRHPCDVVLSCFMQPFGRNPVVGNFTDLETIAHTYRRVMDLWQRYCEIFALKTHELRYENLVANTEHELRVVLDFLDLPWSDGLADHTAHARRRGRIYTPSYHQVIRPLYHESINRWRRYQQYFGPSLEILRPYAQRFGYDL